MLIKGKQVEKGEGYERRQIYRVPSGLYGGMLARYTAPKMYLKYKSTEEEEKFLLVFTLTHDRSNVQLKHFSEAVLWVKNKFFFSADSNMESAYTTVMYALEGGRTGKEQIVQHGSEIGYDLDEYIGRPVILWIEEKKDKEGLFFNKVSTIQPIDTQLRAAISDLYKTRKIETPVDGLAHLAFPTTAYQDDVETVDAVLPSGGAVFDPEDDEIPF